MEVNKEVDALLSQIPTLRGAVLITVTEQGKDVTITPQLKIGPRADAVNMAATLGALLQGVGQLAAVLGSDLQDFLVPVNGKQTESIGREGHAG